MTERPLIITHRGRTPTLAAGARVAPTAVLVGQVHLGPRVNVWYHATLRADSAPIVVGADTNIQDGCVVHADPGFPVRIGARVTVGHAAVVHGSTVEDGSLIGINATVMNGSSIGAGSLVAAGALVPPGRVIPARSLVAGVPATVVRPLGEEEILRIDSNADGYTQLAAELLPGF